MRLSCPKNRNNQKSLFQKKRIFKTNNFLKKLCKLNRRRKRRNKKNYQAQIRRSNLSHSNRMLIAKVILVVHHLLHSALILMSKQSSSKSLRALFSEIDWSSEIVTGVSVPTDSLSSPTRSTWIGASACRARSSRTSDNGWFRYFAST